MSVLSVAGSKVVIVVAYAPNSSSDYLGPLESLSGVLKVVPTRDLRVVLGDLKAHAGNGKQT